MSPLLLTKPCQTRPELLDPNYVHCLLVCSTNPPETLDNNTGGKLRAPSCMKRLISQPPLSLRSLTHLIAGNLHPHALKSSLSLSSPLITDQTYALFLKSGHVLHPRLATSLITHFSKSGDFPRSHRFLLDVPHPDTVAFTALLSAYAQFQHTPHAFALYGKLLSSGLTPSEYTLSSLIKSCKGDYDLMIAHGACVKFGFNSNSFLVSGLVQKYAKCGCLESAWKCYGECLDLDDVVCTAMINACVWNGSYVIAKEVFASMRGLGLEVNEFSLTSLLGAFGEGGKEGEQIHAISMKVGFLSGSSVILSNALMSMYCRCGCKLDAVKVFDEIPQPDVVSWTVRIGAVPGGVEALELFRLMRSNSIEMNELTLINVFSAIEGPRLLFPGKQVHAICQKLGYLTVNSVVNSLISMYGKCGKMDDAGLAFDEVVPRDQVSWNSLIGGYSQNGLVYSALTTFCQMRENGADPDKYTLASILGSLFGSKFSLIVRQLHSYMVKIGLELEESMFSALVTAYSKCHNSDAARKLLDDISEISLGVFHMMASTALDGGLPNDVIALLKHVKGLSLEMDGASFSLALKACALLTNLGQAKAVHSLALKSGFESSNFLQSALVDVYCKCGNIADGEEAFRHVSEDNLAARNAMINGYAQHGLHHQVLHLFKCMTELGVVPDEITFLGVLNSCCHSGLLTDARVHLHSMSELYGVTPCLEHYSCVIDLICRFGILEEAKRMIDQMPMTPDAHIWQSLLSACNMFGDLDLGEVAAKELLKLQPENDSAYVLLSGIYAKAGKWDGVRRLRREMKEKEICKEPGYSWTEIGGLTVYFLAEDRSHPDSEKIYSMLQYLRKELLPPSQCKEDEFCVADL